MSNLHDICFVAQVTLNSVTYYYCSSSRIESLSLGGNTYLPYILSVGDTEKIGNFGEGSQHGKCNMMLMLGQKQYQGNYNIDISLPWNNGTCEIRIYDLDNDSVWSDCDYYYKGTIKNLSISDNNISFDIEDINQKDNTILPRYTVEDYIEGVNYLSISDIPKNSIGKRIPMQFGYLSDNLNGLFAKGVKISDKIGQQEVLFDTETLAQLQYIGIWEDSLKRFLQGKDRVDVDGVIEGEYEPNSDKNKIVFKVDSATTLLDEATETDGYYLLKVVDYTKIVYKDEDNTTDWIETPELLSTNIISIDNELMLLIEKPSVTQITSPGFVLVERGYNSTEVSEHSAGAKIYQSANFASKNMMSFVEKFLPKTISNIYIHRNGADVSDFITHGKFSNLTDGDSSTYLGVDFDGSVNSNYYVNLDTKYEKIDMDLTVYNTYLAVKAYLYTNNVNTDISYGLWDIDDETVVQNTMPSVFNPLYAAYMVVVGNEISVDTTQTVQRVRTTGTLWDGKFFEPNLKYIYRSLDPIEIIVNITNMTDLNKRIKHSFRIDGTALASLRLYEIGLWLEIMMNFADKMLVSPLNGRKVTTDIDTIFNQSSMPNAVVNNPCEVLAYILLYELYYPVAEFDTTSWRTAQGYTISAFALDTFQMVGLSYGIDESEKGWSLCQSIASQFGLMLIKADDGKIRLINLFKLQDKGTYGYNFGTTHYGISIDDIIMSGGRKQIYLQQTGTDRLRNVVKVNYKRNNSTGEYQSVYPEAQTDLDSYVLTESGNTLAQARTMYNSGQKTEVLEIDAFAIYQEKDAERLAKWHLNDKAENHFDVTISLPYYHYSDVNSKTSQYDVGDIIYLDGIYQGITFNSTHKFVVQQINKTNQGRQIQMSAKAIQPVSEF